MRRAALLALPALLLAACSTMGGWKLPWARTCDDRPTDFERHVSCPLGGEFRIVSPTRHPCAEAGGALAGLNGGRQLHLADEYTLEVERGGDKFARVRIEQSVTGRYSHHKHNLMDNLHAMATGTVPGAPVNGISTFWVDDSAAKKGDVETIRVLFDDERNAIVTVYFLRTDAGEWPRELQDAFVDAFTRCFAAG